MVTLLERAFGIRPGERRLVWLFFAFFAGVGMFYTVGATVGDTLFLSHLTAHEVPRRLPWVYVGVAIANVLVTLVFDGVQSRVARTHSIVGTQVILGTTILLARQLVDAHADIVYYLLAVWLETSALLSIAIFFSFAGDYFSARDARRLYGFIAGGISLGTVVSGYAIQVGVGWIGTRNLLYAGAAILFANAAVAAWIFRTATPVRLEAIYEEGPGEHVALRALFSRGYVRRLALLVPLTVITYVTVDYQMKWIASTKSEEALARFFGSFFGWVGLAQIVFQFGLAQRLLQRLGIIHCLMILPIAIGCASVVLYGGSFVAYFGLGALSLSASVNFLRVTLAETLDLPSRELLFLPLPTRIRMRLQPLISGALAPGAQGLAGLLLLGALWLELDAAALSLVALSSSALLLVMLVRLRPEYRETLAASLRDQQMDTTDLAEALERPGTETLLASLLRSSDPSVVRASIALLGGRKLGELAAVLEELVESDDVEIAVAALERLAAEAGPRAMGAIQRAWSSPHLELRQAAVLALCAASGESAVEQLSVALESDDFVLRSSAVIGLARHCGTTGRTLVRPGLEARSRSHDPHERAEAARALGRIGQAGFADLLNELLADPARDVRFAAAEACAEAPDPELLAALLRAQTDPVLRPACVRALAAMPQDAVGPIIATLDDASWPRSERCAMARVLGGIGGPAAARALWARVGKGQDPASRLAAAEGLRAMRARGTLRELDLRDHEALVFEVCDTVALMRRAAREVGATDAFAQTVFEDCGRLQIELLCALLALKHDLRTIDRIRHNLSVPSRDLNVLALELFEEVLPHRLATTVTGALQTWFEIGACPGHGLEPDTKARLMREDPWLRVVTVRHVNQGAAYPTLEAADFTDQDRELYRLLEVVSFLKRVSLLRDISAYYLLEQAEIAEWQALAAGEVLFRQGERGDALYIVCQGTLEVRIGSTSIAKLAPGEHIGELALLDGEPRSADAVAIEDSTLLRVPGTRFKTLLVTQPPAAQALLRTLDRRIRDVQIGVPTEPVASQRMRRSQLMRAQKLALPQLVSTMSFLRQVGLFKDLSTPALANLAGIAQEVPVYAGDTLFEQGDEGESLYLVCAGRIAISVDDRQVAVLERNACLGEMSLVSGLPRSATARALGEGRLLRIGSDDFTNLLATEPEITLALLRTLSERLRAALKRSTQQT